MIWVVLVLGSVIAFAFWWRWQSRRGNLGKVIDYSQSGGGARREEWRNYSASEAKLEQRVGREAAERLIINVLLNNPSKSRAWCADKAWRDLERDQKWSN